MWVIEGSSETEDETTSHPPRRYAGVQEGMARGGILPTLGISVPERFTLKNSYGGHVFILALLSMLKAFFKSHEQ